MKVYIHLYSHDYTHLANLSGDELIGDLKKVDKFTFNVLWLNV
jgi:hypothetical protein